MSEVKQNSGIEGAKTGSRIGLSIAAMVAEDAERKAAKARQLMDAGVTIYRPDTCVIDAEVKVGAGTVLEPFVQLLGKTRVGAGCRIRSFTVIEGCTVGDNVLIRQSCILAESSV